MIAGTEANIKLILNACDPLKLTSLYIRFIVSKQVSDDLLAFIADRMVHLENLQYIILKCTPLFHDNLSKLQNLQKLRNAEIVSSETIPIKPLINAFAKIGSLMDLHIVHSTHMSPGENIIKAINDLRSVRNFKYSTKENLHKIEKNTEPDKDELC